MNKQARFRNFELFEVRQNPRQNSVTMVQLSEETKVAISTICYRTVLIVRNELEESLIWGKSPYITDGYQ